MNARRAAADLVVAILDEHRALDDALAATPSFAALEGRDRAFARALATATLRRLGSIDAVLARFLERPLLESAWHGRAMLRIGAAQMLVLQTPAHAAVGETVETANGMREARGFAKLINAVLRRVSRDGAEIFAAQPDGADLPAWLYARWRATYGDESAAGIARVLRNEPPLDLSVKQDAAGWAQRLFGAVTPTGSVRVSPSPRGEGAGGLGEAASPQVLHGGSADGSARAEVHPTPNPLPSRGGGVEHLPGFQDGAWWVQDAAAALPARLLGDVRGKSVADLCAAPGGKTLQLANAGAIVTAVDRAPERLDRLRQNLERTQLEAKIVAADVLKLRTKEPFDAILLDAPCTATGTLRRHPDVAWLRRPTDIRAVAAVQAELLDAVARMLKPGGTCVYAVCSLEPEEGPGVVGDALKGGTWKRAPIAPGEIHGADEFVTPEGDIRTLPSQWSDIGGLDGFYAARLTRL